MCGRYKDKRAARSMPHLDGADQSVFFCALYTEIKVIYIYIFHAKDELENINVLNISSTTRRPTRVK